MTENISTVWLYTISYILCFSDKAKEKGSGGVYGVFGLRSRSNTDAASSNAAIQKCYRTLSPRKKIVEPDPN